MSDMLPPSAYSTWLSGGQLRHHRDAEEKEQAVAAVLATGALPTLRAWSCTRLLWKFDNADHEAMYQRYALGTSDCEIMP
jgi:hypothetical protein